MDLQISRKPNEAVVFRLHRKPRILKGKAHISSIRDDLKRYNDHRQKIFAAAPKIDNKAPYLNPYTYVNLKKLKLDADRLEEIDKQNKALIVKINTINRKKAAIDCWNKYCKRPGLSHLNYNASAKHVMFDNRSLLHAIENSKSRYCKSEWLKHWKRVSAHFDKNVKLKKVFHKTKSLDAQLAREPSLTSGLDIMGQHRHLRKKVFLDFSVKGGVRLGQIVLVLYNDIMPRLAANFLAHCAESYEYSFKNTRIHYGEKNRYFAAGDVQMQNGKGGHSVYKGDFSAPFNDLKHTRHGVLVAVPIYEAEKFDASLTIKQRVQQKRLPPKFNSQFAITLSAQDIFSGDGPIFGRVIKGFHVLNKINDMLKKCGTPLVSIIISRCGRVHSRTDINRFGSNNFEMHESNLEEETQIEPFTDQTTD